jgi:acetyltransferase
VADRPPLLDDATREAIEHIFRPASIAVVGATERPGYGARVVQNLQRTAYPGRIYPVNPGRSKVFDLPCYPSPLDLPEPPDLALVIVPAERVPEALRQCAERGAGAAVVISAGFAELGRSDTEQRQSGLREVAEQTGLRIVGPNCLGAANVAAGIWATATTRFSVDVAPSDPGAALISQSGATAFGPLLAQARDRGAAFRYIVTTGNEADLQATDFLAYFLERPDVGVVTLLLEGIRDFPRLRRAAERALALDKSLVILKVGRSEVGQRAARSHTAALTGSDRVQDALFRQLGMARVRDYDELIEQTQLLLHAPLPAGRRVGVVSHSGGIGAHLSDLLGVEGLEVPPFAEATRRCIAEVLGERGSAGNPADLTTFTFGPTLEPILEALIADPGLDALLLATQGTDELAGRIVAASRSTSKPIAHVWTGSQTATEGLPTLRAAGIPVFALPTGGARGLAALVRRAEARARQATPAPQALAGTHGRLDPTLSGALSEPQSKRLLAGWGIQAPPERLCSSVEDALAAARELGYPVVVKASSPALPHKSDLGLVRLDLRADGEVEQAYHDLVVRAEQAAPGRLEGVLVQPLLRDGIEVIAGLSDDPQFGRLLMLGLGGTLVEVLQAVTWRVCPLGSVEADAMIDDLPVLATLVGGVRGRPAADRQALVDCLVRLVRFGEQLGDRLESVDLNPLLVRPRGQGVVALDALVVLRS